MAVRYGFPGEAPDLRRWLGDVEPAWTSLAFESFNALRHEPSATNRALSLASDLTLDELNASAVARNALLLVRHASRPPPIMHVGFGVHRQIL